ncbi:MAG TPA: hypothetical protein DC047_20585, partial [Blastocatellia bacterium]|nr:hypothetical protein [Blastocatellia bacterium]
MPRILRHYRYAQPLLVFSLLFSLLPTSPAILIANTGKVGDQFIHPDARQAPDPSTEQSARAAEINSSAKVKEAYGVLPLSFEANSGQTNRKVKFLARGQGYGLFLTATGPVMSLTKKSEKNTEPISSLVAKENEPASDTAVVSWEMVGANKSPGTSGVDALPGKANSFRGNDPSHWRSNLSTYAKVRYSNVYPGIDVIYYGNQRQLEYDFIVAPGKDPNRIKLTFKGADATEIDAQGNLVLRTRAGDITQAKPLAYQEIAGVRREVSVSYRADARSVSFNVGNYDTSRPLIIDPVLIYSSFLGGSSFESGFAVAVDAQGSAYLTGRTSSLDFPTSNAFQSTFATFTDVYVVKLNASGTALLYSTYLGGDSSESGRGIAVDSQGSAYVAGSTFSTNFPTTAGAFQASKDLLADGYLTKLSASGSSLIYSTYLGGDNSDNINGLAVTADGRAVVTGGTDSFRFSSIVFPTPRNGHSAFKSTDKAGQWSVSDNGLTAASVNTFAIDPANSSTLFAACRTGLFKTTDGGSNWSRLPLPVPAGTFYGVTAVIDPSNPAIVYAGTDDGVFKSTDGGASFTQKVSFFNVFALAVDSLAPTTVYAGTINGVFKTTNGGNDWVDLNSTLGNGNTPIINEIVIDPNNSAVVYLGTSDGMFKSTNSGATWANINSGPLLANFPEISALTIDPTNPQILYAAASAVNSNVIKTTNGGATWAETGPGVFITIQGQQNPVVVAALAIDPTTPATLYAASQGGGIFKTTNSGASWNSSNNGLPTFINGVVVDRSNPTRVYAGATIPSDGFIARFNTSGSALEYLMHFGGDQADAPSGIALDADGNAYITGNTSSANFPTVNPLQSTFNSTTSTTFVAKLNSLGTAFVYSTYLGGSNGDSAAGIAVRDGNAFVVGYTFSQDFPVVNAYKSVLAPFDTDAFVAKLNTAGTALDFSTFLGGTGSDQAFGVAVDSSGSAYVTGSTSSSDFPVQSAAQFSIGGSTDAFVTELTPAGNQLVYSTFLGGTAGDQANGIAVDSLGSAYVTGVTSSNNFPTVNAFQAVRKSSDAFFTKIGPASSLATNVQFSQSNYQVSEGAFHVLVVVNRTGFSAGTTTVNYATSDSATGNCSTFTGFASSKCDYEATFGTLQFAAGETSKTISIPIIHDSYAEANETFNISLSNPTNASLGSPAAATITIVDGSTVNGPNPIDQSYFFVGQHYLDFLNREADQSGQNFWTNEIENCTPKPQCTEVKRINVSAAFFLSIEFQETGYLVERLYKTAYGDATGTSNFGPTHQLAVPIVRLNEFLPDSQEIGRGVVVGQTGWEQVLENNKVAFTLKFVQHSRFSTSYSALLTPAQFVDQLFAHAGVTPSTADRNAAINEFGGAATSNDNPARARALRRVAENPTLIQQEKNKAFVLMQFFGYLRRNPNDPQDTDYTGYDFWLSKLNQFNG